MKESQGINVIMSNPVGNFLFKLDHGGLKSDLMFLIKHYRLLSRSSYSDLYIFSFFLRSSSVISTHKMKDYLIINKVNSDKFNIMNFYSIFGKFVFSLLKPLNVWQD